MEDLAAERRRHGFDNLNFWFWEYGASSGGECLAIAPLPEYEIASVSTGQFGDGGGRIWSAAMSDEYARHLSWLAGVYEGAAAGDYGEPVAESVFRIYRGDSELVYHKPECAAADTDLRFLLHIVPQDAADLPANRQEAGFDNLDFYFADYGASLTVGCVAAAPLPEYAIDSIRTGQFDDGGSVWRVEFPAP